MTAAVEHLRLPTCAGEGPQELHDELAAATLSLLDAPPAERQAVTDGCLLHALALPGVSVGTGHQTERHHTEKLWVRMGDTGGSSMHQTSSLTPAAPHRSQPPPPPPPPPRRTAWSTFSKCMHAVQNEGRRGNSTLHDRKI